MKMTTKTHRLFAKYIWNKSSGNIQKSLCKFWIFPFTLSLSRFFIPFFCSRYNLSSEKLKNFIPLSNEKKYLSFQDFFARRFATPLEISSQEIWPCQGHICDYGHIRDLKEITVKGQKKTVHAIFNLTDKEISPEYFFVNIFLHNHHYHHLHIPTKCAVRKITKIEGQLNFLRPWLYSSTQVSEPSLLNERVVLECEDDFFQNFYICLVGGMGVGTIVLSDEIFVGAQLEVGENLGHFLLGSTCCLLFPWAIRGLKYLKSVYPGQGIEKVS